MKLLNEVDEAVKDMNIKEVLEYANLNWTVRQEDLFLADGRKIPNTRVNIRNDSEKVLGIVTERYTPVNNEDAFDFIDKLLKGDIHAEYAGEIDNGKAIYLKTQLSDIYTDCYGENLDCKLIFTNSHDGKGSVKINILPIIDGKVLNLKLNHQKRSWSAMHTKSIDKKMDTAEQTLSITHSYLEELMKETKRLNGILFDNKQKQSFIEALIPMRDNLSERTINNIEDCRTVLNSKIQNNTALGFIMGVSDYIMTLVPKRNTKNFEENKFSMLINGYWLLDKAYEIINKNVA